MADDGTDPTVRAAAPEERTVRTPAPEEPTVPTPPPPLRAEVLGGRAAAPSPDQLGGDGDPYRGAYPAGPGPDSPGLDGPDPNSPGPDGPGPGDPVPGAPGPGAPHPVSPIPSGDRWRLRQDRRQTLTFVASLAVVIGLGLLAAAFFTGTIPLPFGGSSKSTPLPSASCTPSADAVQAASITRVRVLNGSTRRGLALATARELQKRGFKVPQPPGNDLDRPTTAAVVRHGPGGVVAARTIATQVKGKVTLQQDQRLGEDVDLVLGQTFALVDPKTGAAALKQRPAASTCTAG